MNPILLLVAMDKWYGKVQENQETQNSELNQCNFAQKLDHIFRPTCVYGLVNTLYIYIYIYREREREKERVREKAKEMDTLIKIVESVSDR